MLGRRWLLADDNDGFWLLAIQRFSEAVAARRACRGVCREVKRSSRGLDDEEGNGETFSKLDKCLSVYGLSV